MTVQLPAISHQIWDAKYRLKRPDGAPIDITVEDTWRRVARALAAAERPEEREQWTARFFDAMDGFRFIPAGRILAGAGTERNVTCINCFVQGTIPDSLDGIFTHLREAALTMQQGGGIGYDFSTLRPKGAFVRGVEAEASGPLSFMDVWDAMCKTLMSAGARRGAMMACMDCRHPDLMDFITAKQTAGRLTQFNVSVLVTDGFMEAVRQDRAWTLHFPCTPVPLSPDRVLVYKTVQARELWDAIMRSTYDHAEPGVIFIDRVNRLNNLNYCETIAATNPCGEKPMSPYSSCDLGSINLAALVQNPFTPHAFLDVNELEWIVPLAVRMLDDVYDVTKFPLEQQRSAGLSRRRLGLGVTGLANALAMVGLRYGSVPAAEQAMSWMESITTRAYLASVELAREKGSFPLFDPEKFLTGESFASTLPDRLKDAIRTHGLRNCELTSIAPTGTISLVAGNVSSGIEPPFALTYTRKVLQKDGSHTEERVEDYAYALFREMTGRAAPQALPDWFVTAQDLTPDEHLLMLGAVQARVDSSVSKTTNLPESISFEEFKYVYRRAYDLGCKSCTTYRPSEVRGSVLSVDEGVVKEMVNVLSEPTNMTTFVADADVYDQIIKKPDVIDRAVRNSPPPLDDVGGIDREVFDEKDPDRPEPLMYPWRPLEKDEPVIRADEDDDEPDDLLPSRPEALTGATYKVKWADGNGEPSYYVTINDEPLTGQPFEVFVSTLDVDHQAWTTALTRMVSAVFRRGGDVRFVAEELRAIHDPKGGAWMNGKYVPSLPAAIGDVIARHLERRTIDADIIRGMKEAVAHARGEESAVRETVVMVEREDREADTVDLFRSRPSRYSECPRCHAPSVVMQEGCARCTSCEWSRCD